jgi:hypothetical protein
MRVILVSLGLLAVAIVSGCGTSTAGSPPTPTSTLAVTATVPPSPAPSPSYLSDPVLQAIVSKVVQLNSSVNRTPANRQAETLLAARFSSLATQINGARRMLPGVSPEMMKVCNRAIANAQAMAAFFRSPTKKNIRRCDTSRAAFNNAMHVWNAANGFANPSPTPTSVGGP